MPNTCCLDLDSAKKALCMRRNKDNDPQNTTAGYTRGCWSEFENMIEDNKNEILYTGIATILLMVGLKYLFVRT